ncbi:MAG: rRNA pseudouridine synthase [Actinobacteria bacterium]|nr:rRNA pseudouridine synthase [Actinomycetota bacterium]
MEIRLQKIMADAGIASRRKCEELIKSGLVSVDGKIITELGFKADPYKNIIKVNGKKLRIREEKIYIILNKPSGYITSLSDEKNRPTVIDLIRKTNPQLKTRIFPVGRLDKDTEGLLLLTNDGELTNKLIHPRYKLNKVYQVTVKGVPDEKKLNLLRKGIKIENKPTAPAKIKVLFAGKDRTTLEITIHQGKKRQIREMCKRIGHPVIYLKRIRFGPLVLRNLPRGRSRHLSKSELEKLKRG